MTKGSIQSQLQEARDQGNKKFAVLIDPEEGNVSHLEQIVALCNRSLVDYLLVGGSLLLDDALDACLSRLKEMTNIPVVLFPGNNLQVAPSADAILMLSLISGRNPEFLIGQHVVAAPKIQKSGMEVIPTGYMLIEGGVATSVQYMSNTRPIPSNKIDIACATAMAGNQLGLTTIYLDAGSGAEKAISSEMIRRVKASTHGALIVGGGIRSPEEMYRKGAAGADVVVVGNAIEKDPTLIVEMGHALKQSNTVVKE